MTMDGLKPGDLISREATAGLFGEWKLPNTLTPYGAGYNAAIKDVVQAIRNGGVVPAVAEPATQHGRWIFDSDDEYASHYHCDKCGKEIDLCNEVYTEPKPNYCPNCGAKMDGTEGA